LRRAISGPTVQFFGRTRRLTSPKRSLTSSTFSPAFPLRHNRRQARRQEPPDLPGPGLEPASLRQRLQQRPPPQNHRQLSQSSSRHRSDKFVPRPRAIAAVLFFFVNADKLTVLGVLTRSRDSLRRSPCSPGWQLLRDITESDGQRWSRSHCRGFWLAPQ